MAINITKDNYQQMRRLFEVLVEWDGRRRSLSFTATTHPVNVLAGFEVRSPAMAKKSLGIGLTEFSGELTENWEPSFVALVDQQLRSEGLPTLTELRMDNSWHYRRIVKRKIIKDLDEYYRVKAVADDLTIDVPEEERLLLDTMMSAFEQSQLT